MKLTTTKGNGKTPPIDVVRYGISLCVIVSILLLLNIPIYAIVFLGLIGTFVLKIFVADSKSDVRKIFEFYITSSEILRNSGRRWYGFELNEAVIAGENIVEAVHTTPPLLHFALGSLYARIGDHQTAIKHLESSMGPDGEIEGSIVYPTPVLRDYVTLLRKIERSPGEAPIMAASVRTLERMRRRSGNIILNDCRRLIANEESQNNELSEGQPAGQHFISNNGSTSELESTDLAKGEDIESNDQRQTISELLKDIYDRDVH